MSDKNEGHPAWQEILSVLPTEFHSIIKPTLKKWDDGVSKRFEELNEQYAGYKQFVENKIDPKVVEQSLYLYQQMQTDPKALFERANDAFNLGYLSAEEHEEALKSVPTSKLNSDDDDNDDIDFDEDITKHPMFKKLTDTVESLQQTIETDRQQRTQEEQGKQLKDSLDALREEHGDFDEDIVLSMIANGTDSETAVKKYHSIINQAVAGKDNDGDENGSNDSNENAKGVPTVLGGEGDKSSGVPNEPVPLGDLNKSDVVNLVEQMLVADSND